MIDFTANIKSKHSAANILIGENISSYIDELYNKHSIKIKNYNLPDEETRVAYVVNDTITIATPVSYTHLTLPTIYSV